MICDYANKEHLPPLSQMFARGCLEIGCGASPQVTRWVSQKIFLGALGKRWQSIIAALSVGAQV